MNIHPLGSNQPEVSVPVFHVLIDPEGQFLYTNPAFRQEFGKAAGNSTLFSNLIALSDQDTFFAAAKECQVQTGDPIIVQLLMQGLKSATPAINWELSAEP